MTSARAWAHCGNRQIAYARAGNGRTLVLLTTATLDDLTRAPASELARSFRLLRPELSELAGQPILCASCVSGFLEALGVDRAVIVADPKYAGAVEQIAAIGAERVERVVLLPQPLSGSGIVPLFEALLP
jgi:hypothetical protein